ncbi:hypothetical protein Pcinc_009171 [Petrolisthes cinctipes]|uniref:Uncharacterized protein n=1 Tax=Petrolisthes cinctipes TaxID=88211 RepID=A0AAE1KYS4_PETCI|nr:hypothetical protein Pcinc_009171 [Petrolisthes cinctipes]
MEKALGVNLEDKSGVEVDFNFVLAAPVTALASNCSSPAVPLGPSARWKGWTSCIGNSLSSISKCTDLHPPTPSPTLAPGKDTPVDSSSWRSMPHKQLQIGEEKLTAAAAEMRAHRMEMTANRPESTHRCDL